MKVDIFTLILIIGVCHLIQVLVFYGQFKTIKNINGPGWWLLWSMSEVIGFYLLFFRADHLLSNFVIALQNITIIVGTVLLYIGIRRFFSLKENKKLILVIIASFVVLHLFFIFIINDIIIRTLLFDFYLAFIAFLTAYTIYRNKSSNIALAAYFNISIFCIHGLIFTYRFIYICLNEPVLDIYSNDLFNVLQYIDALIVGLLWTFGLIIMLNQKLNFEKFEASTIFEQIFNTSPDAVMITRLNDGHFIACNEAYYSASGYSKEDISGKTTIGINLWKHPHDREAVVKMILSKGYINNYEVTLQNKKGKEVIGLMSAKITHINGLECIISVTRDITHYKLIDQELKNKNDELVRLNAEKDKLFSIIAHDLRGPFNSFLGLTEVLEEEVTNLPIEDVKDIAGNMKNSASNLFKLLENLLNWSRVQQGLIPFNPQLINLLNLTNNSVALLAGPAKVKNITISNLISKDYCINVDTNMFQSIIQNLVSNAIKFSSIDSRVIINAKINSKNEVEISVEDSGIGMDEEILANLFKIDAKTSRKGTLGEPSTGLGLILCKEFIEKNYGKIWVESKVGKGSTFYFTLQGKKD